MMTVMIKKIGGSVAVLIPSGIARDMDLREGASLDVTTTADALVMRKTARRRRRSIAQIAKQIKPASYRRRSSEMSGGRIGKELW